MQFLMRNLKAGRVTITDLTALSTWAKTKPKAPEGEWYKKLGQSADFYLSGRGVTPTSFTSPEASPWRTRLAAKQAVNLDEFTPKLARCYHRSGRMSLGALIPKYAFALERKDYIRAAWAYMKGGIGEYFKAEIARLNNYVDEDIRYWERETRTLINSSLKDFVEDQELKGSRKAKTRKRALEEAIRTVDVDKKWAYACDEIAEQLNKPVSEVVLPDRKPLEAAYWARVRSVIDKALGPD